MAALLAAPVVWLGLGDVPAAQAAPDPALKISSVTVAKTTVTVSGLNTVPVTVTVTGSYDTGTPEDAKCPDLPPTVRAGP